MAMPYYQHNSNQMFNIYNKLIFDNGDVLNCRLEISEELNEISTSFMHRQRTYLTGPKTISIDINCVHNGYNNIILSNIQGKKHDVRYGDLKIFGLYINNISIDFNNDVNMNGTCDSYQGDFKNPEEMKRIIREKKLKRILGI